MRAARPSEAAILTALAIRSKAHWGYDAAFMAAAAAELTVEAAQIERGVVFVAERAGEPTGFYHLVIDESPPQLRDLFVEPAAIGTGVGSILWHHMLVEARRREFRVVRFDADPNAAAFYEKKGARRVGSVPSQVVPGRVLPSYEMDV